MNRLRWDGRKGHYEVFYAKAVQGDDSLWVRYTLLSPWNDHAIAEVWAIADVGGKKTAAKVTQPIETLRTAPAPFVFETPAGSLHDTGCKGKAEGLEWDLKWEPCGYDFHHLPGPAYKAPIPKTKVETPGPDLRVSGTLKVDGKTLTFTDAPGQQGHVWGTKHAESWAWSHCNTGLVWEALTARVRTGNRVSPPLTTVLVRHDGKTLRFLPLWRALTEYDLSGYSFTAKKGKYRIEGSVSVPAGRLGCITYTDPDGEKAYCHNTKRADSVLRLWHGDELVAESVDEGGTAYEVGQRTRDADVALLL